MFNRGGKIHPECGLHDPTGPQPNKNEKVSLAVVARGFNPSTSGLKAGVGGSL